MKPDNFQSGCGDAQQAELPLFAVKPAYGSFEHYDSVHTDIWQAFEEMALKLIKQGYHHYGSKALFEKIRYHTRIDGGKDFKVNNTFTANYARKFIRLHPEHKDFFELRETKI